MKRSKRILAVLICAVMVMGLMPGILPAEVGFALDEEAWQYELTVWTSNADNEAGTRNDIYFVAKTVSGAEITLGKVGSIGKNTSKTITPLLSVPPWELASIGIKGGSSDAVHVHKIKARVYLAESSIKKYTQGYQTILETDSLAYIGWIGGKESHGHDKAIYRTVTNGKSTITNIDAFASTLSGTTVLNVTGESGTLEKVWSGAITDQYMLSRWSYNVFDYNEYGSSPTATVSVKALGTGGTNYGSNILKETWFKAYTTNDATPQGGFSVDREKLLSYMNEKNINLVTVTTTIKFPDDRISNDTKTITREYNIVRNVFTFMDPVFSSNYSTPTKNADTLYYNNDSSSRTVYVDLQVNLPTTNPNAQNTSTGDKSYLNQNHLNINSLYFGTGNSYNELLSVSGRTLYYDRVELILGSEDNKETVVLSNTAGSRLMSVSGICRFTFTIPSGADSQGVGLTVKLYNARIPIYTATGTTTDFYLYDSNEKLVTSGDKANLGYKSSYDARYKVDRVTPTITLTDPTGEYLGKGKWTNTLELKSVVSENMYVVDDESGYTQMLYQYTLVDESVNITAQTLDYIATPGTGATTNTVPAAKGSETTLKLALAQEREGKFYLIAKGIDQANNKRVTTLYGIWLDNKPPVVSMTDVPAEVNRSSGTLTKQYIFDVTDLSLTGKCYYYIDTTGSTTAPEFNLSNVTSDATESGTVEDFNDRWIYIPQTDNDTSTTDGAFVITLAQGESFTGVMYYLGADESGNVSSMKSTSINLQNTDLTCSVDYEVIGNKNDYEITLTAKDSNTKVSYRWLDSNEKEVVKSQDYEGTFGGAWGDGDAWDGAYILEYTVTSQTLGTSQTTKETFVFDNNSPEITIADDDAESYADIHVLSVSVNDTSAISEIIGQYYYYTPDGEAEHGDEFSLIDADSNGVYTFNEDLLFEPEMSGAYVLRITATDENGNVSEAESGTILIRNAPPEITEATLTTTNGSYYDEDESGSQIPIIKEGEEYKLKIDMSEAFINPEMAPLEMGEKQVVYYRVTDGSVSSTSSWTMLGELTASELTSEFAGSYELTNPAELVEGKNIVTLEFVIAAQGRSYYESEDQADVGKKTSRVAKTSYVIYYAKTAPPYSLTLEDIRTTDSITGKLVLFDEYALGSFDVEAEDDAVTLELITSTVSEEEEPSEATAEDATEQTEEETEEAGEEETAEEKVEIVQYTTYAVTVSNNTSSIVTVKDQAGNSVEIPIVITGIDREGPSAEITSSEIVQKGDRQDAELEITVSGMARNTVEMAVIPSSELSGAVTDGVIGDEYFTNYADLITYSALYEFNGAVGEEIGTVYSVKLAGADGEYYIGVRAADELGNTTDTVFGESFEIVNAEAALEIESIVPKAAGVRARVTVSSNIPIYILPQSMITDTPWSGGDDDDYDIDTTNLLLAEAYANAYSLEHSMMITDNGTYKLYVCDELGRTSLHEFEIGEDLVTFGNILNEPTVTTYVTRTVYGYDENDNHVERDAVKTEVAEGEYAPAGWSYMDLGDYDGLYYAYEEYVTTVELVPADGTYLQPNDDIVVENGLWLNEDLSEMAGEIGYTKLVYDVDRLYDEDTWEQLRTDVRELPVYICTEDWHSVDDWYSTSVYIDNIDNTSPDVSISYDPMLYDPLNGDIAYTLGDVTVNVYASDAETGVDYIYIYDYENDINYSVSLRDENGDMIDYSTTPYTFESDAIDIEIYSETNPRTEKVIRLTIHENMDYAFVVYNSVRMATYSENDGMVSVESINKIPLSEEHYTLTYYGSDAYGNWQVVDPEDENTYFRVGKVVITPTEAGNERGLYVANNSGSWERDLNILGTEYIFNLKDQYGHELLVETALTNFDMTGGVLTYELDTTTLSNSATVTITAYDAQSGVDNVTMAVGGSAGELLAVSEEDGLYTYQETLTKSGTYTITLTDKVGNVTQKTFMVSTIDSEAPEIAGIVYTTTSLTDRPVIATLTYTKKNVTLKTVEPAYDGFTDYEVDYANSKIRFLESGTVDVSFADAYGNVGYGSVSVGNIYTIPPSLVAVMDVADNKQSVTVTFEKALDENLRPIDTMRELEDITVMYGGIARRAEWPDDEGNPVKAAFTFLENGTYQFEIYDDAGITTYMTIAITGIDTDAPQITQVSWSYNYDVVDEDGSFVEMRLEEGQWVPGSEAGYMIFTDSNPITNYDVDVTVETDSETKITGKTDSESATEHTLTYTENGSYMFNLEKDNGMLDSYGFEVGVIDKTPPVIEFDAPELIFYENANMNSSYNRDLLDKGFKAYDVFRGVTTDLTDRVKIDYGTFDPENMENNKYDRTKPYTITYTVTDDANNTTETTSTVRLVAMTDTIVLVNGAVPNASNRAEVTGTKDLTFTLQNFSGIAYAKVAYGALSMGEMKTGGSVIEQETDENGITTGKFTYSAPENGWYTVLIQTDKRDYFNLQIYVYESILTE